METVNADMAIIASRGRYGTTGQTILVAFHRVIEIHRGLPCGKAAKSYMVEDLVVRSLVAAVLAGLIAVIARRHRLLDTGGSIAAVVTGVALVATGGWWAGILLVAFFVTSSLLSASEHDAPSRTWRQVVANGGPATLFAILAILPGSTALITGSAACLAAATADTWATEIGRRSGAVPRSITSLRHVPAGTSGAVSLPGSVASVAGALVIAALAVLLRPFSPLELPNTMPALLLISVAGSLGSLVDTVLGATLQARYRCGSCSALIESPGLHDPAHDLRLVSGWRLMTNDAVNASASAVAGVIAAVVIAAGL